MRMMLKVRFPTDVGNRALKDGSFPKLIEAAIGRIKPEAAYFVLDRGCRSAMLFFDLKDVLEMPSLAEPLFIGLGAELELLPVMNAEDLKKGLGAAMQAM